MDFIADINTANVRKTIHLIRHGQTDFNRQNIIQGSGIDSDLNETGRLQALKFHMMYGDLPYDRIYTSRLKRAIQSVQPFIERGIPHTPLEELNEINWGIMEGRISDAKNTELYNRMIDAWSKGQLDISVEGGETPAQMFSRQQDGLRKIMSVDEELILVCMHGRALRSFLCLLTGHPLHQMEKWEHSNLCLYELEWNGKVFEVSRANDISHL